MFGIFNKKKKKETVATKDVATEIEAFMKAYCHNNKINIDAVCISSYTLIEQGNTVNITIRAAYPQKLIGLGGSVSKDLAKRLSKYLNRDLRLEFIKQI